MDKKVRHHYVWQFYLRPWTRNGKIKCSMGGNVFNSSTKKIGVENNFYKLKHITDEHINFIEALAISKSHTKLQNAYKGFVDDFNQIFKIGNKLKKNGINSEKVNDIILTTACNLGEDFHTHIENIGRKYIEQLYNSNLSFVKNSDDFMMFTYYLCTQYMRTQKQKNTVLSKFKHNDSLQGFVENTWHVLTHIFANNIALSLYLDRSKIGIYLIENKTKINFITGDQPIINIHSNSEKHVTFYYPITPNLALLITDNLESYPINNLADKDVHFYNEKIKKESYSQIYALNEDDLD